MAQSFHPLLGILEVVLRNRINDVLTSHFADPDWIINQATGFMIDPSLTYDHKKTGQQKTNNFLLREVKKAETRLRNSRTPVTSGKVIAEQTLGFWTDLFEAHNYRILKGKQIKIFNHLPSGHGRKEVNAELDKIRRFRNRINHNEPICFDGNNVDFSRALDVYQSITNILTWIDPEILNFIKDINKVNRSIVNAMKI
ncbi:MAG: hypothetical protein WDN75_20600 [Bacteroidota bacterium]